MSRLRWRCRRGTRELDIVFSRFLDTAYESLSESDKAAFDRLLDCEDDDLQAWIFTERKPTDGELLRLVERIRASI